MKTALVYDRVNKFGGAERVLLSLHKIWPDAPLFTSVYDINGAPWAHVFQINWSFLQHVPFARTHHELYPWVTPMAFQTFTFDDFDVVISVTSAEAKGIITKPHTTHICYCLTPTRYLWSGFDDYSKHPGMGGLSDVARPIYHALVPTLRRWDRIASARPDYYLAISNLVKDRIQTYYNRHVESVVYPPVDLEQFIPSKVRVRRNDYFLVVSRLVGYKRVDLAIDAFGTLGIPLVVIGKGLEADKLKARAHGNVHIIDDDLTDGELLRYYQECRALVVPGQEDFGLVAVEAQACGIPVIAFGKSGIAEIVHDGDTGVLFWEQSARAIEQAIKRFLTMEISSLSCRKRAERFDENRFVRTMETTVLTLRSRYINL